MKRKITKIWREIKKPLLRLYYLFPAYRAGVSSKAYAAFEKHRNAISLAENGKVAIPYLEIDVVIGCNLKCEQCSHLSPFRKGLVPADELLQWFRSWSEKIEPAELDLLGGEPLLHPELPRILRESVKIWDQTEIKLITNGFMFAKVAPEVFRALEETQIQVVISDHCSSEADKMKFEEAISKLRNTSVRYKIRKSNRKWIVQYNTNPEGVACMFSSRPKRAWETCLSKTCVALANNKLYKCAVLSSMIEGVAENALSRKNWSAAFTYKPLTLEAAPREIMEHLLRREVPACTICPDRKIYIEPKQIVK